MPLGDKLRVNPDELGHAGLLPSIHKVQYYAPEESIDITCLEEKTEMEAERFT